MNAIVLLMFTLYRLVLNVWLNAWSVSVSNLFLFLSFLSFCSLVLVCDFSFAVEAKIFLEVTGTMVLLLVIS